MVDTNEHDRELDRFWDDLTGARSEPGVEQAAFALDAEVMDFVRRLQEHGAVSPPAPVRARVRRGVLARVAAGQDGTGSPPEWPFLPVVRPILPGGKDHPIPRRVGRRVSPESPLSEHRRSKSVRFAAGLVVVATLLAFSVVFSPSRHQSANVPVARPLSGTPHLVWETHGGPKPLHDPYGLTIDPGGNLWVADGLSSRFQLFAPDGTYLETWGIPGSDAGQFNFGSSPDGFGAAAFDADGNLYVADADNHRVQKFGPDHTFLTMWGSEGRADGQFLRPGDIAVDRNGRVFVLDIKRSDIQVFTGDGGFLFAFGAAGAAGERLNVPVGLAIDAEGNVWVADNGNHRVAEFDADGAYLGSLGGVGTDDGQFYGPSDLAIDALGRIYVAEYGGNRVQVFDHSGRYLTQWGSRSGGDQSLDVFAPQSITVDARGQIYVSEESGNRVRVFRFEPTPLGRRD